MERMNETMVTARPGRSGELSDETYALTAGVVDLYAAIDALPLGKVLEIAQVLS